MSTEILNKIEALNESDLVSFHMPGHKNGRIYDLLGYSEKIKNLYKYDTTEIFEMDDLHDASGVIQKSQKSFTKAFYKKIRSRKIESIYVVNGSTCGIQSAIMSVCFEDDYIIMDRNCHKSAQNACVLCGSKIHFVKNEMDKVDCIPLGVDLESLKNSVKQCPSAKAIFVTYPNYYGMCCKIEEIAKLAHENNLLLIVDEAHGSHFALSNKLPISAIDAGADIVINSVHKTLPSFTQTSVIHVQGERVNREKLKSVLSMLETSSPSYIFMSSIEICGQICQNHGEELVDAMLSNIVDFKIQALQNYSVYNTDDPSKIFINTIEKGIPGYEFAKILRYDFKIQVEMSDFTGVLLLCSIGNTKFDFEKLLYAINEIWIKKQMNMDYDFKNCLMDKTDIESYKNYMLKREIPKQIYTPREAFNKTGEKTKIEDAENKVAGENIVPYPPGICLIAAGEKIEAWHIQYINFLRKYNMEIHGIDKDGKLYVI